MIIKIKKIKLFKIESKHFFNYKIIDIYNREFRIKIKNNQLEFENKILINKYLEITDEYSINEKKGIYKNKKFHFFEISYNFSEK